MLFWSESPIWLGVPILIKTGLLCLLMTLERFTFGKLYNPDFSWLCPVFISASPNPQICVIFFSPKTSPMFWMWFLIKAFSSKCVLLPLFFSGIEDSFATDFCHAAKPQTNCGRISRRVDHLWFLSFFNNCTSWCETSRDIIYRSRQFFRCRCEKPRSDCPQRKLRLDPDTLNVDTINLFFQCKIRKRTSPTSTWEVTIKTSWTKCWQQQTKFDFFS